MSSVSSIAAAGMAAVQKQLDASAQNVANAAGALDGAPDDVVAAFTALSIDQTEAADGGTTAKVSDASPGRLAAPDVDLANEIVRRIIARYTFVTNARVLRAEAAMQKSLLDVKA